MLADALTFLAIVVVLTVTPGADMALLMRHVLAHGFRATWPTIAGIETGLAIHVTLCVAGLSVVLRESTLAFSLVKLAGAAWLAWLGASAILAAVRSRRADRIDPREAGGAEQPRAASSRTLYGRGLLTNLLNVKIALFYIAFLPQFAPAGDGFVPVALALAAVQALVGFAWLVSYAAVVARAGAALQASPLARRWLEGTTGVALLGFSLRLATAAR